MAAIKQWISETTKLTNEKKVIYTEADLKNSGVKDLILRDYQLMGASWLINAAKKKHGIILGDEMGLGKTCQTIAALTYLKQTNSAPSLVLCPLSVLSNWESEIQRFCHLTCVSYVGPKEIRATLQEDIAAKRLQFDVLLTTYELCINDAEFLNTFTWSTLVVDEAHRLKNMKSVLYSVVGSLTFTSPFLLTGTPIQNNLHELYALLKLVAPKLFRTKWEDDFVKSFGSNDSDAVDNAAETLHDILEPFLLRRTKNEVLKDLPHKTEVVLFHGITDLQKKYYKAILMKDYEILSDEKAGTKTRLLNILMQLRKCVNHPYLFDGVEPEPFQMGEHLIEASGKLLLIDHLLKFLKPIGHKVLLFSQMTRMLDILQDYLSYRGYPYERLDGSIRGEERYLAVKNFNENNENFVFLLSTKAGGQGLNLVSADTVIFIDSDFNPQNDLQAAARAHRIGQTRPVKVIRLIGRDTVDEIILRRAETKLCLTKKIIEGGQYSHLNKTADKTEMVASSNAELQEILKFGLHELMFSTSALESVKSIDLCRILGNSSENGHWECAPAPPPPSVPSADSGTTNQSVDHMYIFEGHDYSKEGTTHDDEAWQKLLKEKQAENAKMQAENALTRNKAPGKTHVALEVNKSRRTLTDAEKEQRRKKREETLAKRKQEEEEKELRRAQKRKERQEDLWLRHNYTSMSVSLNDTDEENSTEEAEEGEEEMADVSLDASSGEEADSGDKARSRPNKGTLSYVKGNVAIPKVKYAGDAIVCHAVDDSGRWGTGGVFSAIHARSQIPEKQYELASKMCDLSLGDVHLIPFDDTVSRNNGADYVALLVCQHRDRHNSLSGLKMLALEECLKKVRKMALQRKASVHLPRMGYNTPNFNWYGVERLIRKCLILRGVHTSIYYYSRGNRKRPIEQDEENQKARKKKVEFAEKEEEPRESAPSEQQASRIEVENPKCSKANTIHAVSDSDNEEKAPTEIKKNKTVVRSAQQHEISDSENEHDNLEEKRTTTPIANKNPRPSKNHEISDSDDDNGMDVSRTSANPFDEDSS